MRHEKELFDEIIQALLQHQRIAVTGHLNPDGDCLGSCLAFGTILKSLGKEIIYMTPSIPTHYFHFLEDTKKFTNDKALLSTVDCILVLDTGVPERSVLHELDLSQIAAPIYQIDHHLSNPLFGDLNLVNPETGSVCELLASHFLERYEERITPQIATYLFMGISTDSGHFMREPQPHQTFPIAAKLLQKGADKQFLIKHLFRNNSLDAVKAVGMILQRIQKTGHMIRTRLDNEELATYGVDESDVEVALLLLTSIDNDGAFVLFKGYHDGENSLLKGSFRSQDNGIDVSWLTSQFGGGGHKASAGAKLASMDSSELNLPDILPERIEKINTVIDEHQ